MTTSSRKGHGMEDCICAEDAFCEGDCPAMDCNQESKGTPMDKPLTDSELESYLVWQHYRQKALCKCGLVWPCAVTRMAEELRAFREGAKRPKPLTDAELDALGKDARWDSLYGERAIAELRALRTENAQWEDGTCFAGGDCNCAIPCHERNLT